MALEDSYKAVLMNIIDKQLPGCLIWLFGSRARKTNMPGADFDIAIDAGRTLTSAEIFNLKEALEESSVPVFVDIVDIRNVSHEFLNQISQDWIAWKQ